VRAPEFPSIQQASLPESGNSGATYPHLGTLTPSPHVAIRTAVQKRRNGLGGSHQLGKPTASAVLLPHPVWPWHPTLSAAHQASFSPAIIQAQQNNSSIGDSDAGLPPTHPFSLYIIETYQRTTADLPGGLQVKTPRSVHQRVRRTSLSVQSEQYVRILSRRKTDYYSVLDGVGGTTMIPSRVV